MKHAWSIMPEDFCSQSPDESYIDKPQRPELTHSSWKGIIETLQVNREKQLRSQSKILEIKFN